MSSDHPQRLTLEPIADDPDRAVHHVLQHEAEHRSHIAWLRDTYRSADPRG